MCRAREQEEPLAPLIRELGAGYEDLLDAMAGQFGADARGLSIRAVRYGADS